MVRAAHGVVTLAAARAGERIVAVGERGVIVLSDDDGRSWQQVPTPVSVTLTGVRFADDRRGVAIGHGGTVLTTDDAGLSWTRRLDGIRLARLALDAAKASAVPARIDEAERLVADGPDKPFLDVLVWDARRLLAVGAYGIAFYSGDGGVTWTPWMDRLPNPRGLHLYAVRARGNTLLLAGEQGLLARSDDAGATFRPLASPYHGSWFTAEMPAADEIVLAGLRGNVWRSTDGGVRWTSLPMPLPASITGSALAADGTLYFASQAGVVFRRQGEAVRAVHRAALPPLTAVTVWPGTDGDALLALSVTGPVRVRVDTSLDGRSR